MITLEIVKDEPPTNGNYYKGLRWWGDVYIKIIPKTKIWLNNNYRICTQRPGGTWYILDGVYGFPESEKRLHDLIESGLEPYQAFEVLAL